MVEWKEEERGGDDEEEEDGGLSGIDWSEPEPVNSGQM